MAQHERPDDQAIRQSLDGVLSSALFSRSERLRAFLNYVVDKEMEGTGHQLKGYTIGIDVFDRPQAFNADSDPLVRVHAGKLRKLLAAYYASEGAGDLWRIDIPKGTYVPEYRRQRSLPVAAPEAGRTATPPRRARKQTFLVAACSAVVPDRGAVGAAAFDFRALVVTGIERQHCGAIEPARRCAGTQIRR